MRTDPRFLPPLAADPPGPVAPPYPAPHAGYFEWVFVLDSVVAACAEERRPVTVVELGAGCGPWLVVAHRATELLAPRPVRLVGVEMGPRQFAFLEQHLRNNGIDPAAHRLIHAAVSEADGGALFVAEPEGGALYGQRIRRRRPRSFPASAPPAAARTGMLRVPCVSLTSILEPLDVVDLLHMDVQGEEWRALRSAAPAVAAKVRRLIVATHSRRIERRLRSLFAPPDWEIVWDFRCRRLERTPYGDIQFLDGLFAAINHATGAGRALPAP